MIRDLRATVPGDPGGHFIYPQYGGLCFADISNSILSLMGVDPGRPILRPEVLDPLRTLNFKHVLFLLIDGLGFDNWVNRAVKYPFFQKVTEHGEVTSLTAVFPSTTSASLTAFSTGLTPQEHGLLEWTIYLPEIDDYIFSLPFRRWNGARRDELADYGLDASALFKTGPTVFEKLSARGIPTFLQANHEYVNSIYSRRSYQGAERFGFYTASDMIVALADKLNAAKTPTFCYGYYDMFDNLEHIYSPYGVPPEVELEHISQFCTLLLDRLEPAARRDTLLIMSADHGQGEVSVDRLTYLTDHEPIVKTFALRPNGRPYLPVGGPRDSFLHVQPEKIDDATTILGNLLAGKADIVRSDQVFAAGLFGLNTPLPLFRDRVGNLIVLPYYGESVWADYTQGHRHHFSFKGHHGGLSANEMFIPFAAVKLDHLV
jgi:predicted AlkP superfamily pyrophosphatase or phosphodiesterase